MALNKVVIKEILRKECEIEASDIEEAIEIARHKYTNGEIILDYDNLDYTEFSNTDLANKEIDILAEISEYCANECCSCDNCVEDECVLFRIEKAINSRHKPI